MRLSEFLISHCNTVYRGKMWRRYEGIKIWIPPNPSWILKCMQSLLNQISVNLCIVLLNEIYAEDSIPILHRINEKDKKKAPT